MSSFLIDQSAFKTLLSEERMMELGPGSPNLAVLAALESLDPDRAFAPRRVIDRSMAEACLAGLWLYHDFLDQSHRITQSITTTTGSYWHAILHRREPDSWNSKYWFQRVVRHPVFPELCTAARALAQGERELAETRFLREQSQWDPFAFVDLCEHSRLGAVPAEMLCRRIQLREWQLLFSYCERHAAGDR